MTPYAEIIGDPIAQSKSPTIHGFWLMKLALPGEYRAVRVTRAELPAYLEQRRHDPDWRGCNATMPLKQTALEHLDRIEDEGVGAVNCIVPRGPDLVGSNTDVAGIREALALNALPLCNDHAATLVDLVGTGGAARAALAVLRGFDVTVFARDKAKADALLGEFGQGPRNRSSAALSALMARPQEQDPTSPETPVSNPRYDRILINATSLGMRDQPDLAVRLDRYSENTLVFDMVYDPVETPLLKAARERNMTVVDGLVMLVGQAASAFEQFFGLPAPREHDAELRAILIG